MGEPWYESIPADASLDQGDLVFRCPVLAWKEGPPHLYAPLGTRVDLRDLAEVIDADAVVMTQTCDLAQRRVRYVVLCPHDGLGPYHRTWEAKQRRLGQTPTAKSWATHLDRIAAGQIWNLAMLNSEEGHGYCAELRIVDFHEVFSLPRAFLEAWLAQRGEPRLRLRPPYREHLSQAFARFFMRVGLPTDIRKTW
jgi:hypothetical protein